MSGTGVYPALMVQPPDPLGALAKYAQLQQSRAQTGYIGAQTQGQNIQNQLQRLMLGYRGNVYGEAFGDGGTPTTTSLPAGGAGGGINALPPVAGSPGSAPPQQGTPDNPNSSSLLGFPAPRLRAGLALMSNDPSAAAGEVAKERSAYLFQLVQSADPGTPQWKAAADQAYGAGWIDGPRYQAWLQATPERKQQMLQSLASPDANLGLQGRQIGQGVEQGPNGALQPSSAVLAAKTAIATGEAGGKAQYEPPVEMTVDTGQKDGNGQPIMRTEYVPRANIPSLGQSARPTNAADLANPNNVISPAAFAGRVVQRESGGNYGATSGASSAGGGAQIIDSTWLSLLRANRPDLAQGKTDQQLLAMKTDTSPAGAALQNQMAIAYARQNAPLLSQAGVPVNSLTLGLAHQFGASGAVNILTRPADTPITAAVVGAPAMKANPQFQGKTIGDVQAAAFKTYGVNPVNLMPGAENQPAPTEPAPVAPGAIAGNVVQTPQQAQALALGTEQGKQNIQQLTKMRETLQSDSASASQMNGLLDQMRQESQTWQMGKFADAKNDALAYLDSAGQSLGFKPNQQVGDWQAFNKNALELVRQAVRATSARAAVQEFNMISKALPNAEMTPQGFTQIADELQGINDWKIAKSAASAKWNGQPNDFESQWATNISPTPFIVHRMSQSDTAALAQRLNQTPQGKTLWGNIVQQMKLLDKAGAFATTQPTVAGAQAALGTAQPARP